MLHRSSRAVKALFEDRGAFWIARMPMPDAERAALEAWLVAAPPRCAEFFQIVVETATCGP
jgi:hypothetical protein